MTPKENNERSQKTWFAGSLAKASLALAGFALGASAMAATPSAPEVVQSAVGASQMPLVARSELSVHPDKKIGAALQARLSAHAGLPAVKLALMLANSGDSGSRTLSAKGSQDCEIIISVDAKGRGTLAAELPRSMGIDANLALNARLLEFEAAHELGHCHSKLHGDAFNHPGLGAKQNAALGSLLMDSKIGDIWEEAFADSYAALTILRDAPDGADRIQALRDLDLIRALRSKNREDLSEALGAAGKSSNELIHVTEGALEELAKKPSAWLDASTSLESRAAQLASIGTLRAVKMSQDPAALAMASFDMPSRVEQKLEFLAKNIQLMAMLSAAIGNRDPKAQAAFSQGAAKVAEASFGASDKPFDKIMAKHAGQIASIAYEVGLSMMDNPKLSDTELAQAPKAIMDRARADGVLAQAVADLPKGHQKASAEALALWGKALASETGSPSMAPDAKPAAVASAKEAVESGEARLVKTVDPEKPAQEVPAKLKDWRSKRAPSPPSAPAPLPAPNS